jgi:hypothetical protein
LWLVVGLLLAMLAYGAIAGCATESRVANSSPRADDRRCRRCALLHNIHCGIGRDGRFSGTAILDVLGEPMPMSSRCRK